MMTTAISTPLPYLYDPQDHHRARLHDLSDTQHDLIEALDGLTWQQDQKKAELVMAETQFKEIAAERAKCLYNVGYQDALTDRLHQNQIMADAALAQLHVAAIQKQIDYLEKQITRTRTRLAEIKEQIALR